MRAAFEAAKTFDRSSFALGKRLAKFSLAVADKISKKQCG